MWCVWRWDETIVEPRVVRSLNENWDEAGTGIEMGLYLEGACAVLDLGLDFNWTGT